VIAAPPSGPGWLRAADSEVRGHCGAAITGLKEFLEVGKRKVADDMARGATSSEVNDLFLPRILRWPVARDSVQFCAFSLFLRLYSPTNLLVNAVGTIAMPKWDLPVE
jgi:hypothetical protein